MRRVRGQRLPNSVQGMSRKALSSECTKKRLGCSFDYKRMVNQLKNQTKSERGKNKNAKAADKVTEMAFSSFGSISRRV